MEIVAFYPFRDHYKYRKSDFQRLTALCEQQKCDYIATTEKDLVKWIEKDHVPANALALAIKTRFENEDIVRSKIQSVLDLKMKNA